MKRNEKCDEQSGAISTTLQVLLIGSKPPVGTNDILTGVVEGTYTTPKVHGLR
jgi:hypothetical protein